MKKALVIGIKGMAGHLLFRRLPLLGEYEIYGIARNIAPERNIFDLDVSNTGELEKIINKHDFDVVINCIGILNKDAEDNPAKAIWFNSYFPHFLEKITASSFTKLIHISTDCVFSGKRGAYTENDVKDGTGFYAQSKALGEIDNSKDLTIRTSIIGPELNASGIGLFHWFMSRKNDEQLKGFSSAYWSGITTVELASVVHEALCQNIVGLIQVAPKQKIDKYNLLKLFNDVFRHNELSIFADDSYKVDKSLVSLRTDFNYEVPGYRKMLEDMRDWIAGNTLYMY